MAVTAGRRDTTERGKRTMLVKAKWNVKDSAGWHRSGDVFNTKEDLGDAVEMLEKPGNRTPEKAPEKIPEKVLEQEPVVTEPEKRSSRRKKQ